MAISIETIRQARERIAPYIRRTPLLDNEALSSMASSAVYLKAENLQRTGAFKVRGVVSAVLALSSAERRRGVFTFSAGNTGLALAYAGHVLGVPTTVMVPDTAPGVKVDAIREYGAEVLPVPPSELLARAERVRQERDLTLIHPWENASLIAGHGTIGLEILEDLPDVDVIVTPVGGGGLIAGVASAVKTLRSNVRIVGVEPEGSQAVAASLAAGEPVQIVPSSIADGLNAPSTAPTPLSLIGQLVDDLVTVDDASIARAMGLILRHAKLVVEPSGAAAVAALVSRKVRADGQIAVPILTGGNVGLIRLSELLSA